MATPDQTAFMREAAQLAHDNVIAGRGGPFGAVIVRDGQVIGRGANLVTSSNDPTAHAEVSAIRDACQRLGTFSLAGADIYTSCEPCPMCLAAIYWARIEKIFYANTRTDAARIGFDDDFLYQEIPLPYEKRSKPILPLTCQEAAATFDLWTIKTDKVPY